MTKLNFITTIALIMCVALISGLFFSFSIAVSPGLKHVSDIEFIKTMKGINKEILNGLFFLCFFSPLLLFPFSIYLQQSISSRRWLLLLSGAAYFLVILITATINVPINNQLEKLDVLNANKGQLIEMRYLFENRWTYWNNIRTVLSTASLFFLIVYQFDRSE